MVTGIQLSELKAQQAIGDQLKRLADILEKLAPSIDKIARSQPPAEVQSEPPWRFADGS